jgi:hypothetical protein
MDSKHTCRRAHLAFYIRRPTAVITIVPELPNPNGSWRRFASGLACNVQALSSSPTTAPWLLPRIGRTRILLRVMDSWCVDQEAAFTCEAGGVSAAILLSTSGEVWRATGVNHPHALILPHLSAGVSVGSSGQLPWASCSLQGRQQAQTRKGRLVLEANVLLALCPAPMHSALMPMPLPLPLIVVSAGSVMSVKLWIALINGDATALGRALTSGPRPMDAPNLQQTLP